MVLIAPFIIALLNILTNHTMLTRKKAIPFCVIAFLVNTVTVMAFVSYINTVISNPTIYKYIFYMAAFSYIGYIYLVFSESFSIKLFTMFSTWVFSTITLAISNISYNVLDNSYVNIIIIQGIRIVIQTVFLYIAIRWFGKYFKIIVYKIHSYVINLMSGYMFLAMLLLINSFLWNEKILGNAISIGEMLLLISFIILGYIIVFFAISSSSKNDILKTNVFKLKQQQLDMRQKLLSNDKELLEADKLKSKIIATEMAFLQAQIKPHFLYNALNAIANVSEKNGKKGSLLILDLAIYLRGSLAFNNLDKMVTIEKELEFTKTYFNIEQARFGEKIRLDYQIKVPYENWIPVFILQPLVENAVRHGISKKIEGGTVVIKMSQVDQGMIIEVFDDGVGIKDEMITSLLRNKENNEGIGLMNIHQRLINLYGQGLYIESELNRGTSISFIIPQGSEKND